MSLSNTPYTYKGKIPRIIFQSWKTNDLSSDLCNHVFYWSNMNPQYDYFLFDDDAIDRFIQLEYGEEIFSSYACVKVCYIQWKYFTERHRFANFLDKALQNQARSSPLNHRSNSITSFDFPITNVRWEQPCVMCGGS